MCYESINDRDSQGAEGESFTQNVTNILLVKIYFRNNIIIL